VTSIPGVALTSETSGPLAVLVKLVDETFFATLGVRAEVMISSQSSGRSLVCFVIPTSAGPDALNIARNALEARLAQLQGAPQWHILPVSAVTVIGANLDSGPDLLGRIMQGLENTPVLALSLGTSHCSLSLVVSPQEADSALRGFTT
jgi:aspartokinase